MALDAKDIPSAFLTAGIIVAVAGTVIILGLLLFALLILLLSGGRGRYMLESGVAGLKFSIFGGLSSFLSFNLFFTGAFGF